MARYIDVEKLDFSPLKDDFDRARAVTIVKFQPTADVVEVKHGEWKEEIWCDNFQHTCSLCHSTVRVHPQSVAYKYCPYCGAKMDGERKKNDKE